MNELLEGIKHGVTTVNPKAVYAPAFALWGATCFVGRYLCQIAMSYQDVTSNGKK